MEKRKKKKKMKFSCVCLLPFWAYGSNDRRDQRNKTQAQKNVEAEQQKSNGDNDNDAEHMSHNSWNHKRHAYYPLQNVLPSSPVAHLVRVSFCGCIFDVRSHSRSTQNFTKYQIVLSATDATTTRLLMLPRPPSSSSPTSMSKRDSDKIRSFIYRTSETLYFIKIMFVKWLGDRQS